MENVSVVQERAAIGPRHVQYSGFRWATLAACCFTVIAFQISAMSCAPLLGEIARNLNVGLSQAVNVMTVFMLFSAISYFPAGYLSQRFNPLALLIISAILSSVGATSQIVLGHSLGTVLLARALQGCAVGFTMAAMAPLVMQWFSPEQRGLALGIGGACIPIATAIGVMVSPVLFRAVGSWQLTVAYMSIFAWLTLVYCIVVRQMAESRAPQKSAERGETRDGGAALKAALSQPYTWLGVVVTFTVQWVMQCAFSLSPSYFAEPKPVGLDLGTVAAGQMMGIVQIGAIIGPIVGGLLLDKLFRGRSSIVLGLAFLLTLSYCGLQSQFVCSLRPAFLTALLLFGAGLGMLFPMIQCRIAELYEHQLVGPMNGLWLGIGAFGGSAGLLVNSIAIRQTGGYILPINIISATAALGLVLCVLLARSGRRV